MTAAIRWNRLYGSSEKFLTRQKLKGRPVPQLGKKPSLTRFEELIHQCVTLFGAGPADVKLFCEFFGIANSSIRLQILLLARIISDKIKADQV